MFKMIKRNLKKKKKGAIAFETVIVLPVVFIMMISCLIFFFSMITYVSYNNMANTIAQNLDMRATGYLKSNGTQLSGKVKSGNHYNVDKNKTISGASIATRAFTSTKQQDPLLLGGLNSTINSIADKREGNQLNMPFTAVKSITAMSDKPINTKESKLNAGNVIKVEVEYYPLNMFKSSNFTLRGTGYATIS